MSSTAGTWVGWPCCWRADGLRYRLGDGQEFKTPSAAGSAIMGGNACNGWRFWSIAEATSPKSTTSKARAKQRSPRPRPRR